MTNLIEKTSMVRITWVDAENEYDIILTGREAREFEESYANEYAEEDAEERGTTFEEIESIHCETECYDNSEEEREYWMEFNRGA